MNVKTYLPFLEWLPKYTKHHFKSDIIAGLTVGVLLIPQGMAYAMIAGLEPIYGLYAATVPLLIYALLGTSRQLAVGPVAMVSLLTASSIAALHPENAQEYLSLALLLALMVGLILVILGLFKMGFIVNFLSHPVLSGFTSAAALIIGFSQLKHLLALDIPRSHHIHKTLFFAFQNIEQSHLISLTLGIGGILLIVLLKKWNKSIPGALILVVISILIVWIFDLHQKDVKILGSVPAGLPSFVLPNFQLDTITRLLPGALAISLVSFMESIAVAKSTHAKHRDYKIDPNQELLALGMANIGGAFFQSYPTTGGFSRTAVNDQAGAKSTMASIISAMLVLLCLLFLTPLFYYLPKAVLASIIMVAVFGLIDINEIKHLWNIDKTDFWMLITTFIATLAFGVEKGIATGVVMSLILLIYRTSRPHIAALGNVPNTNYYRNIERFEDLIVRDDILIVRIDAQLYFANINYFRQKINELITAKSKSLKYLIINAESINNIDSSALAILEEINQNKETAGLEILFTGVKGPVRDMLDKDQLLDKIGRNNFFMSVQDAVNAIDSRPNSSQTIPSSDFENYANQSNT